MDLRSSVHRASALDFSKDNGVYGGISWPARSPDLSAGDFLLWGCLKRRVFQTRYADLHNFKLRISEERNAISPTMSAWWKVSRTEVISASMWMDDTWWLFFVVMFLNNGKYLSFKSHYFKGILVKCGRLVHIYQSWINVIPTCSYKTVGTLRGLGDGVRWMYI
jgi:hypothetical protein